MIVDIPPTPPNLGTTGRWNATPPAWSASGRRGWSWEDLPVSTPRRGWPPHVAFVLGGGGLLGAAEVGMLRALDEAGVVPDVVLGTSIGAINGAVYAGFPGEEAVNRLERLWTSEATSTVFGASAWQRMGTLARSWTHAHPVEPLRALLVEQFDDKQIDDLEVPFQCVAASIERASEHWFTDGPVVDALLASSAVPGLLPPAEVRGEHFFDGGLVHSIPLGRAVALGAQHIFVLQVGRIERPLEPPRRPWEVAAVSFEIARRHRFAAELASAPDEVAVHVLPTGDPEPPRYSDTSALKYRDTSRVSDRIRLAQEASADFLAGVSVPADRRR
jgi:NTE family protein